MNYAVVLAGGKGQRFGNGKISKQFVELTGVPMIIYSLQTADKNNNIDEVCVVVAETEENWNERRIRNYLDNILFKSFAIAIELFPKTKNKVFFVLLKPLILYFCFRLESILVISFKEIFTVDKVLLTSKKFSIPPKSFTKFSILKSYFFSYVNSWLILLETFLALFFKQSENIPSVIMFKKLYTNLFINS